MRIDQFCSAYPQFCIDFSRPLKEQHRIYSVEALAELPYELEPWVNPPRYKGRGTVNVNQTLCHYQCVSCNRVLRNDAFHLPPSFVARNRVFAYCKNCYVALNAQAYEARSEVVDARRRAICAYLAPRCAHCGFQQHPSAIDMHHNAGETEGELYDRITRLALAPTPHNGGRLLAQASKCVPLCANCHRMLHAGALSLGKAQPLHYTLASLMSAVATAA